MARRAAAMARARPRSQGKSKLREWVEAIGMAFVLTFFIRTFVVQAFRIPSGSMLETLQIGDFLFVNKLVYGARVPLTHTARLPGFRHPRTGDIVVFKFPRNPKQDYIKRVIAGEGQTVQVINKVVYVDGKPLTEPYVKRTDTRVFPIEQSPRDNTGRIFVPPGKLFCMGDNRENSEDSRFWGFVPYENVKGKAFFLYFSWDADHHMPRFSRFFHVIP